MVPHSDTVAETRARLERQLALVDMLIAIAEQSAVGWRRVVESDGLAGKALAEALTALTVVEASLSLRRAERDRLLATLAELEAGG
jgi:hypothetical protein